MNRIFRIVVGFTTVGVALVASCSADSVNARTQDRTSTSPPTNEQTETNGPETSPLDEYLGEGAVSFDNGMVISLGGSARLPGEQPDQDELDRMLRHQELVAGCMEEAGFEYVVWVPAGGELNDSVDAAYALPAEEFAAEYGFGLSTIDRGPAEPDPNADIRDQLPETDRHAYQTALYGDGSGTPESSGDDSTLDTGCAGEALNRIDEEFDPELAKLDREALEAKLSALHWRIQDDERIVAAAKDWSACMHDRGIFDVNDLGDPRVVVLNRWNELSNNIEGQQPVDVDLDALEKMREFEIEIAVADHECRAAHVQDTFDDVVHEHEEEFVARHQELLETFRIALNIGVE